MDWMPTLLLAAGMVLLMPPITRRLGLRAAVPREQCARCGYAVVALPLPRCPECGVDLTESGIIMPEHGMTKRRAGWPAYLGILAAIVGGIIAPTVVDMADRFVPTRYTVLTFTEFIGPSSGKYASLAATMRESHAGSRVRYETLSIRVEHQDGRAHVSPDIHLDSVWHDDGVEAEGGVSPMRVSSSTTPHHVRPVQAYPLIKPDEVDRMALHDFLRGAGIDVADGGVQAELDEVVSVMLGASGRHRDDSAFNRNSGHGYMSWTAREHVGVFVAVTVVICLAAAGLTIGVMQVRRQPAMFRRAARQCFSAIGEQSAASAQPLDP